MPLPLPRSADPYRDLAVIDERAPRTNQLLTGQLALAALVTGAWPLVAVAAVQISTGLLFGRRWCLACRLYFGLIQPTFGEGRVEDARPVKFANQVGATFLWSSTLAHLAGFHAAGNVLAGTVAALALLAATTGFCAGCAMYRGWAFVRGVRGGHPGRLDLAEVGGTPGQEAVVQFTHPLCADCRTLTTRLTGEGRAPLLVDVSKRPDLARKYGVSVVPLAFSVLGDGRVERRVH